MGGFETVALLLRKGANVDVKDRNGTTALHLAARNGSAIYSAMLYMYTYIHTYLLIIPKLYKQPTQWVLHNTAAMVTPY